MNDLLPCGASPSGRQVERRGHRPFCDRHRGQPFFAYGVMSGDPGGPWGDGAASEDHRAGADGACIDASLRLRPQPDLARPAEVRRGVGDGRRIGQPIEGRLVAFASAVDGHEDIRVALDPVGRKTVEGVPALAPVPPYAHGALVSGRVGRICLRVFTLRDSARRTAGRLEPTHTIFVERRHRCGPPRRARRGRRAARRSGAGRSRTRRAARSGRECCRCSG